MGAHTQPFRLLNRSNRGAPSYPSPTRTAIATLTAPESCVIPTRSDIFNLVANKGTSVHRMPPANIPHQSRSLGSGAWTLWVLCTCVAIAVLVAGPLDASAKRKKRRAPRPEPQLKILEVKVIPNPFTVSEGPAEFSALVQLPKELNGATLLEVSSLVSSPSKTSIRFLSVRQPVEPQPSSEKPPARPRVSVVLSWDGLDHNKTAAEAGTYHYELRAKLLVNGDKGPRTQMVSWPKRGTIEVK